MVKNYDMKEEIRQPRQGSNSMVDQITYVRSKNVRELLGISDSTLQTMRINGTIPCYKLGTSYFYRVDEIIASLENGRNRKRDEK